MKKAKKLTVLFLTGSLALCAMPTHTNAGLFSDFFSRKYLKYHVALTASTLFIAATLTDFYVENEKVETGKLLEAPFYLRQLGDIATGKVLIPIVSMLLGRKTTTNIWNYIENIPKKLIEKYLPSKFEFVKNML